MFFMYFKEKDLDRRGGGGGSKWLSAGAPLERAGGVMSTLLL